MSKEEGKTQCEFNWSRGRLFDKEVCKLLLDRCKADMVATVTTIKTKNIKKLRPFPLNTIEAQKMIS
mgnify:CR=1 FL=1